MTKFPFVSEFLVRQQLLNLFQHSNNDIPGFDCKTTSNIC